MGNYSLRRHSLGVFTLYPNLNIGNIFLDNNELTENYNLRLLLCDERTFVKCFLFIYLLLLHLTYCFVKISTFCLYLPNTNNIMFHKFILRVWIHKFILKDAKASFLPIIDHNTTRELKSFFSNTRWMMILEQTPRHPLEYQMS